MNKECSFSLRAVTKKGRKKTWAHLFVKFWMTIRLFALNFTCVMVHSNFFLIDDNMVEIWSS